MPYILIHELLKCGRRITKAKWHSVTLGEAKIIALFVYLSVYIYTWYMIKLNNVHVNKSCQNKDKKDVPYCTVSG